MTRYRIYTSTVLLFMSYIILTLPGCDDSTGPEALLEGTWIYNAEIGFPDRDCVVENVALMLSQGGDTFSGTVTEGTVTCVPGSTTPTSFHDVSEGTIDGGTIQFNMGGDDAQHSGVLSGGEISGNVQVFEDNETGQGSFLMDRP